MSKNRTKGMKRQAGIYRDEHAKQQNHRCAYCRCKMIKFKRTDSFQAKNGRTADHIIPLSSFGLNVFYNILAVCYDCNQKKDSNFLTFKQMLNVVRVKKLMTARIAYELLKITITGGVLNALFDQERIQNPQSNRGIPLRKQSASS